VANERHGGCSCGRIRFSVRGEPELVAACHCRDCRRHTGAPVSVFADFKAVRLELSGAQIDWFETSPGAQRGFCARCGATLAFRGANRRDEIHLHIGAFDDPAALSPTQNENTDARMPWLALLTLD
jgi:hypothetical protein